MVPIVHKVFFFLFFNLDYEILNFKWSKNPNFAGNMATIKKYCMRYNWIVVRATERVNIVKTIKLQAL